MRGKAMTSDSGVSIRANLASSRAELAHVAYTEKWLAFASG